MFIDDPDSVRYDARVKAGKAMIDSVSIADRAKATDLAKKIVAFRADYTVAAINKALKDIDAGFSHEGLQHVAYWTET